MPAASNTSGSQTVSVKIDSVDGDLQKKLLSASRYGVKVSAKIRFYLSDDKSKQAQKSITGVVKGIDSNLETVNLSINYFDILNTNFNRITYNAKTAPCLIYQ